MKARRSALRRRRCRTASAFSPQRGERSLVSLWREFNLHLARVIESTPEEAAQKERTHHNLDQIAFSPVLPNEPVTLAWFMNDYVVHLRHHLAQVFTPVSS